MKKRDISIGMLLVSALWIMMSCSEDHIEFYSGPDAVNITLSAGDGIFVEEEELAEKTFDIKLAVQSAVSEKNRVIKFEYGKSHTAVAGVNFELPMEVNLEPGRLDTIIQCKVFRTGLTYEPLLIDLRIAANADFNGGGVRDSLQVKMMLGFPAAWRDPTGWAADYGLGECTQAKYKFVYEQIGTLDLSAYVGDYCMSLARKLNEELEKNPRLDDDGSPMRFGI